MRVLVLGAAGMMGYAVWNTLRENADLDVWGTLRNSGKSGFFPEKAPLLCGVDVLQQDELIKVFESVRPQVVINCIGVIKQLAHAKDPLAVLPTNALFPHRLAKLCALSQSRLIHMSTDCVFSGDKGNYVETDPSDAKDLYGKSKYIGELTDLPHVITLRTSIIGHELNTQYSLIDWFMSQKHSVKGYVHAIFSGLPTVELGRVIRDYIIPDTKLSGLYHVSADPIGKYDLLKLVAQVYNKKIAIEPDHSVRIDRSLCSNRFKEHTGYMPPSWPQLIEVMHKSKQSMGAVYV